MNLWQMNGGSIERWPAGGGRAEGSISIHPFGRSDDYRAKNRANRFKPRMHGRRDLDAPAPVKGRGNARK